MKLNELVIVPPIIRTTAQLDGDLWISNLEAQQSLGHRARNLV